MFRRVISATYRKARRLVIAVVGGTILLIGIFLLILPGPAIIVIPVGLAILSLEFTWARNLLRTVKRKTADLKNTSDGREK
ncbi:MAG: PGPGW domain-containing protein [Candidatus Glassbacteria bacterium]